MRSDYRWDLAITHRGTELKTFVEQYFDDADRSILLIAGAGFDPRTGLVAAALARATRATIAALLISEVRTESDPDLVRLAEANLQQLVAAIPDHTMMEVTVFGADNSVSASYTAAFSSRSTPARPSSVAARNTRSAIVVCHDKSFVRVA